MYEEGKSVVCGGLLGDNKVKVPGHSDKQYLRGYNPLGVCCVKKI